MDPQGRWLWAPVLGGRAGIRAFAVDRQSGTLQELASSPFDLDHQTDQLVPAASGRFLFAAHAFTFVMETFAVDSAGLLASVSGSTLTVPAFVCAAPALHPSGRFLYVPLAEPDGIAPYGVNSSTGILTATGASAPVPDRPSSLTSDPSGRYLYLTTATPFSADTVFVYSIDSTSGSLTRVPGSAFDPAIDLTTANLRPNGLVLHPTGGFAYVTNRPGRTGARSLGVNVFSVQSSGRLGPNNLGPFTTEGRDPQGFALDPSGRFAYMLDATAGTIEAFAVDPATGGLSPIGAPVAAAPYPVGLAISP
jgi:6-phosphogluconolactonase (cycloisomerase 2 family)